MAAVVTFIVAKYILGPDGAEAAPPIRQIVLLILLVVFLILLVLVLTGRAPWGEIVVAVPRQAQLSV